MTFDAFVSMPLPPEKSEELLFSYYKVPKDFRETNWLVLSHFMVWQFLRRSTRAAKAKTIRGTIAIKGMSENLKGPSFRYGVIRSLYGPLNCLYKDGRSDVNFGGI